MQALYEIHHLKVNGCIGFAEQADRLAIKKRPEMNNKVNLRTRWSGQLLEKYRFMIWYVAYLCLGAATSAGWRNR